MLRRILMPHNGLKQSSNSSPHHAYREMGNFRLTTPIGMVSIEVDLQVSCLVNFVGSVVAVDSVQLFLVPSVVVLALTASLYLQNNVGLQSKDMIKRQCLSLGCVLPVSRDAWIFDLALCVHSYAQQEAIIFNIGLCTGKG